MSHLFWISTLVPGFAVLQAAFPGDVRRGLLGTLTWSFLLTVALMTPVVVIAFLFQAPAWIVSAVYLGLVILGAVGIARYTRWADLRRAVRSAHWAEIAIILVATAVTLPLGGSALDDSFVHAAKIRYMRDVGFSLQDPYSPLAVIETRYHVSVHHSLYAIAAWLTREEPLELWFRSAWFFRLISLGGIGFFAATVFRSRWAAALAMLGAFGVVGSLPHIAYPFGMTPYIPFPLLFAFVLDMLDAPSRRTYLKIVLASLSLAVLHIGFWLIVAMCLIPPVALRLAAKEPRGRRAKAAALLAGATLPGLPFLLITALQPNYVDAQQGLEHLWMLRTVQVAGLSITVLDPTHYTWMLPTVAATGFLLLVRPELRGRQTILAGALLAAMIYMFTPGIFDVLSRVIPYWLVRRARYIGELVAYVNIAGGLALVARRSLSTRPARIAFAATAFCAALVVFRVSFKDFFVDRQDQWRGLLDARQLQEVVRTVPPRSLVAADTHWSLVLPSVHLVSVMAPKLFNSNPADGGVIQRQKHAEELLAHATTPSRRREIVAADGIDFILTRDAGAARKLEAIGDLIASQHGFQLVKVRR